MQTAKLSASRTDLSIPINTCIRLFGPRVVQSGYSMCARLQLQLPDIIHVWLSDAILFRGWQRCRYWIIFQDKLPYMQEGMYTEYTELLIQSICEINNL